MEGGKDFDETGTGAGQVDTGDHNGVNESNTSFQTPFNLPPGFRFCPKDDELINHYLIQKILNRPLPYIINEVNLYDYNPQDLSEKFKPSGEKEWYLFTPRDKKYRNGSRPNRAAGDGYWKATGADKPIITKQNGIAKPIGVRKALVFYKGKPPKGNKTNWIMHEYRLNESKDDRKKYSNSMRLDDWVLCRIYKKPNNDKSPKGPGDEHSDTVNSARSIEELPYASKINTSDIFDTTMLPTLIDPVGLHFPNDYSLPTYNPWFSSGYPSHPCDSNLSDPSTCDIFNNHYANAEYGQVDQYLPIESNASDTSTFAMMMNKYGPMPQTMNMKEELNTAPLIDMYSRNILGQYDASGYQDEAKGSNQRKEKQKISPAKHQEVLLKRHYN